MPSVDDDLPDHLPDDLLTALVEAVTARTRDPATAVRALREVLTGDRPDWAARAARALATVEAAARGRGTGFAAASAQQRLAVLEDLRADAETRWLAALVQDVHHADPATWAEVGWRPGTTVDDVDPDGLAALDDLARSLTPPERVAERYDVVVVGSGAGGGTAAWKLAASGRRVLLVERAAWTGTAALARDHLRNPRSPSGLAGTGEPREPRSLLTPEGRSLHRPGDHRWGANAMTVGGGTRLYGAQAWRFAPDDFRMATRYGVPDGSALADWPIDHDDLEPYYDEAEWELGVSGRAGGDPWAGPRSRDYPMPPLPATAQVALLERGARALGLGTLPVPLLVNSRPRDGRGACVRCTQCVGFACPVGARGGSHTTALPRALATGACTVVAGARAERLVTDASGRVVAVALVGEAGEGNGSGSAGAPGRAWRRTVSCAEVVLAAGAVETARLLLASAHPGEPHGLGNDRDQVGRHLQGHLYGGATAVFDDHDPDEVVDLLGPGPAVATCDLRHGNPGIVGGGMLANEFVPTPAHAFRWLVDGGFVPPHGPDAAAGVRALARRLVRVVGPVQEVTGAASRVRLDPRATDRHGNAVAMLSGGVHAEDRRGQEFLSAQAERWLRAAGARRVHRVPPLPASAGSAGPSGGQHQAGTCRMGTDPARSVVDPFGRLWGHEEVRVVDASVHVTNGGVNPVLTVHALALRTTEHLVTGRTRRRVSSRG